MPTKPTPQELGRQFERDFAENELGGLAKPVPGSGALPQYNLDVDQLSILWSLKHTTHASIRLTEDIILEAFAGAEGPGSRMVIPALALRIGGLDETIAALRMRDLLGIARREIDFSVAPSRRETKRALADPLAVLRAAGGDV
jgi:hypothetical protein